MSRPLLRRAISDITTATTTADATSPIAPARRGVCLSARATSTSGSTLTAECAPHDSVAEVRQRLEAQAGGSLDDAMVLVLKARRGPAVELPLHATADTTQGMLLSALVEDVLAHWSGRWWQTWSPVLLLRSDVAFHAEDLAATCGDVDEQGVRFGTGLNRTADLADRDAMKLPGFDQFAALVRDK